MGGPVAPGMAAQEAMAPAAPAPGGQDPTAMLQQVETQTAQQAQGVGAQYAQSLMSGIDAAETPEQIINALRGNEMPMDQRYAELAQFVGEADAQRTPESVLALVQPTIMMTEEGFMDSGVGELMKNFLGSVEMETESGEPTPMGQGVGSLMMAGAPAPNTGVGQQPVANFNQGGVVQRFQTGGEASRLQTLYSEMLPVYQSILGDGQEQRRMTQAQILFDIADRAGAFAAGVDPRSGQSIARLSPAAQLAAAASGLGGQIGQRLGAQEEQDRALRVAALQAAQGEYSAERAAARAAGGRERGIGDAYEAVDADGNVVAMEFLSTRNDLEAFREANPGTTIRQSMGPAKTEFREVGGNLYDLTDRNNPRLVISGAADKDIRDIAGSLVDITDPANPVVVFQAPDKPELRAVGDVLLNVTDPANPQVVYQAPGETKKDIRSLGGSLVDVTDPANPQIIFQAPGETKKDIRTVGGRVIDFTDPNTPQVLYEAPAEAPSGEIVNILLPDGRTRSVRADSPEVDALLQQGGRRVSTTAARVPSILTDPDLMSRYAAGTTSAEETARIQADIAENTKATFNSETGRFEQPTITPLVRQSEEARRAAELPTVITFPAEETPPAEGAERERVLAELGGAAFGTAPFFQELANTAFALVDANAPFPAAQAAVDAVGALNQDALIAFREVTGGRTAQEAINQFQQILPTPARITSSPGAAASEIQQVINLFNANIQTARESLRTGVATPTQRQTLEQGILNAQSMVRAYGALLQGISGGGGGAPVDPAQFRRN
jgi:hypothetical protein